MTTTEYIKRTGGKVIQIITDEVSAFCSNCSKKVILEDKVESILKNNKTVIAGKCSECYNFCYKAKES